ncbi:Kcnh2, partial [Symbiodinium sp. KB8]
FALDLVTALPLEHLVDGVPGQVESVKLLRGSKIFKILKVIRAIKLIKIFRASELGSRVEDFVTHSSNGRRIFEACRILVSCCMLCHWLACFMPISGNGFLNEYEFKPESTTSQYISSLYWAMTTVTTVGYGDILPTTDDERIFTMLAMIVGGAFYGYVVGNISVILASNDVNWRAQKERLELIEAWLTHHRFPTQLRRRIWAYYKQTVNSQVCWDDATVFYELSVELREDVATFLIHPVLPRNLIFRGVPTSAMIRLVGILQQVTAKKRERIVPSDKFVMGMFLILDGGAVFEKELEDIVAEGSEGRKKLTELLRNGDSFGEEVLLGLKNEYEYTVTASRKLVLLFVPRDRFIERLANMPEVFGIMRANFVG